MFLQSRASLPNKTFTGKYSIAYTRGRAARMPASRTGRGGAGCALWRAARRSRGRCRRAAACPVGAARMRALRPPVRAAASARAREPRRACATRPPADSRRARRRAVATRRRAGSAHAELHSGRRPFRSAATFVEVIIIPITRKEHKPKEQTKAKQEN